VIAAPSALFSLLVGKNSAAHWVLLGAVLFAMLGALSVPLVSLFTVCGMGIDCL
jgi:hypothetical protein